LAVQIHKGGWDVTGSLQSGQTRSPIRTLADRSH